MKLFLQDKNKQQSMLIEVNSINNDLVLGVILQKSFHPLFIKAIQEFELLVNTQQFALLDETSNKIAEWGWYVEDKEWTVYDLQIFNTIDISFKIKKK